MTERRIKLVDRHGRQVDDGTLERFGALWDELDGGDPEHATVSVRAQDEWNLAFEVGEVLFENVGDDGDEVGVLPVSSRDEALAIAGELIAGDLDALRARPWS